MKLKYSSTNPGLCRVYYKINNLLYCWQEDGTDEKPCWTFCRCSKDGEPSHSARCISTTEFEPSPGTHKIDISLNNFLKQQGYISKETKYLGYFCDNCGPYSRESGYFRTREQAEKALKGEINQRLRDTKFHGGN